MTIEWNNVTEKKEGTRPVRGITLMKKAMSRVCSEILVGHLFLSFTFFFFIFVRIFRSVCFMRRFFLMILIGSCSFFRVFRRSFFSHLETENRGSRAPCESSVVEKRRETEGRTDAETRRYTPSWLRGDSLSIIIDFGLRRSPNISAIVYDALELLHRGSDRNTISAAFTVTEIRWSELLQRWQKFLEIRWSELS